MNYCPSVMRCNIFLRIPDDYYNFTCSLSHASLSYNYYMINRKKLLIFALWVSITAGAMDHVMLDGCYTSPASGIYPGTERTFQVYVPGLYDGKHEACLYVGLDGVLCRAPEVMDSLISCGAMPVTIGVFLNPGVIKDKEGNVLRYNRSNEFDATDDTFARFLSDELLPQVEAMTTPDGRQLRLSQRGNDCMIFGLSSGGIAAFTTAWHRPDLFRRVFSGVGTFVAMRGGNDLQAIVRKSEPRPLKVFLQDGSNDAWNALFGHWYEGNRMLATALEFAGYDCRFDWSDGSHNVTRATEIFADVMSWMWSNWHTDILPGTTHNDFLAPMLIAGEQWQSSKPVKLPAAKCDSAISPDSSIIVTCENGTNYLQQHIVEDGKPTYGQRFYWLHTYDNSSLTVAAMAFDGNGNLWVVTNAGIQICDQNGRVRGILTMPCLASDVREIIIGDGKVTLQGENKCFSRRLNVTAPMPGKRPHSQGQG